MLDMVLDDEGRGYRTHDRLREIISTVRHNNRLSEQAAADLVSEAIIDKNIDLLHHHQHGADIVEVAGVAALAEQVVELVVEAVLLLVHNDDLLRLLDEHLLEPIVDNLHVLLLDVEEEVLVVDVIEAVDEVELVVVTAEARALGCEVAADGIRGDFLGNGNGLCSY